MPLTDTHIRSLKPDVKPRKYFDGGGLFLFVPTNGSKLWRMAYRFDGKSKLLSFGEYPTVSLKDARERREEAKRMLSRGIDPSDYKRQLRQEPSRNATASRTSPENGMKPGWRSFPKSIREPSCTDWRRTSFRYRQNAHRQTGNAARHGRGQTSGTEGKL